MMHISMNFDPHACLYDASLYDAHIHAPRALTLMRVSMMRYFSVTNERTNGQGDSRSRKSKKIQKSKNQEIQKSRNPNRNFFWKIQKALENPVVLTPADLW